MIIPLEDHRESAERCVRAWAQRQTCPRDRFEILLLAPATFPKRQLGMLRTLLNGHDRVLSSTNSHDITLNAEGACAARGDVLFFTESHCWPEPDVLEKVCSAFSQPDCAALSCRMLEVTHNALSRVEAGMYQAQMEEGLRRHAWRRVTDPCFAIRREVYERSGGFEPELGHFAEWAFAARLFHLGQRVHYLEEACVHHYYIGKVRPLRQFTEDFVDGETALHARTPRDPRVDLLPEIPGWRERHFHDRILWTSMLRSGWREWRRQRRTEPRAAHGHPALRDLAFWLYRVQLGPSVERWACRLKILRLRLRLHWRLWPGRNQGELRDDFLAYLKAVIHARRLRNLARVEPLKHGPPQAGGRTEGVWTPAMSQEIPFSGLYMAETWRDALFCWTQPAVMLSLPLTPGKYRVTIECAAILPQPPREDVHFYFNGKRVAEERVKFKGHRIRISLRVSGNDRAVLGWFCRPLRPPGDSRALGLALRSISWCPTEETVKK